MSCGYSVSIKINKHLKDEYIQDILKKGEELNIEYFELDWDYPFSNKLNLREAFNNISVKSVKTDLRALDLIINKELWATILLNLQKNNFSVSFVSLSPILESYEAHTGNEIYLASYTRIMLFMTQDFPISSIEIEKDYPSEELNENENRFYLRLFDKIDKSFCKNIVSRAIDSGVTFYRNDKAITSTDLFADEIYYTLLSSKFICIKFKADNEEGFLCIECLSYPVDATRQQTDSENRNYDYKIETNVTFINLKESWIKKFPDGTQALDLSRYAQLMLNLVDGFELNELKIGKL